MLYIDQLLIVVREYTKLVIKIKHALKKLNKTQPEDIANFLHANREYFVWNGFFKANTDYFELNSLGKIIPTMNM